MHAVPNRWPGMNDELSMDGGWAYGKSAVVNFVDKQLARQVSEIERKKKRRKISPQRAPETLCTGFGSPNMYFFGGIKKKLEKTQSLD